MDKLVYVFNKLYTNFIEDIHAIVEGDLHEKLQSVLDARESRTLSSHRYIERVVDQFVSSPSIVQDSIASDDVLEAGVVQKLRLVKKITVADIKSAVKKEDLDTVRSYVYIFILLGYLYTVCKQDDSSDEEDDQNTKSTIALIDASITAFKNIQGGNKADVSDIVADPVAASLLNHIARVIKPISDDDSSDDDSVPAAGAADMLKNTKIGSLAKEISEEIDLSSLKIEKPEDLLNPSNLMGGNNVLTDIIGKVGSKIHQKIDKGEIKHEELMSEAINMLGMLGKGGDSGAASFLQNPLFKDVMKNMGNLSGLANMAKSSDKAKSASVRDRLRKKLDKKGESKIL